MGRGDKRTRKGKIFKGSYGNSRPQRVKAEVPATAPKKEKVVKTTKADKPVKKAAPKKAAKKKSEE